MLRAQTVPNVCDTLTFGTSSQWPTQSSGTAQAQTAPTGREKVAVAPGGTNIGTNTTFSRAVPTLAAIVLRRQL